MDKPLIDEAAEVEYTPSGWPCPDHVGWTPAEILQEYLSACKSGADKAYSCFSDQLTTIRYGERVYEEIDVIAPASTSGSCSLFALFHGGYWQEGHFRANSMHLAHPVIAAGHYFAGIGYLDIEQLTLDDIITQAVDAVNQLAEYASDHQISSIVLSGHSAGAHLVVMLAIDNRLNPKARQLIKGMALLSGVFDVTNLLKTSINIPKLALGDSLSAQRVSPLYRLPVDPILFLHPPSILIAYGQVESPSFRNESINLHKLLEKLGMTSILFVCPEKDHFTSYTDAQNPSDSLATELVAMLNSLTLSSTN
ncbi:kynurenine formamidase-like [Watersipora subatra]|uniref:kynurenine formamidase-like n=1 Tax=Watersipora subatra TaxID=2589382 RepID=UPI00355ADBDB